MNSKPRGRAAVRRRASPLSSAVPAKRFRRLLVESLEERALLTFTPGNVLALRVGTGAIGLSNLAAPVFIDEFNPNDLGGAPVQSIALPTTTVGSQKALTAGGN